MKSNEIDVLNSLPLKELNELLDYLIKKYDNLSSSSENLDELTDILKGLNSKIVIVKNIIEDLKWTHTW